MTVLVNDAYGATREILLSELESSLVERAKQSGRAAVRDEAAAREAIRVLKNRRSDFNRPEIQAAE